MTIREQAPATPEQAQEASGQRTQSVTKPRERAARRVAQAKPAKPPSGATPNAPARGSASPLPASLRQALESLSGVGLHDVSVHRHSPEPAHIGALAFAKGNAIHLGPGQERHLPHEAWHVVQQRQGRVPRTGRAAGVAINDDPQLEREADRMGARAASVGAGTAALAEPLAPAAPTQNSGQAVQRLVGFEIEDHRVPVTERPTSWGGLFYSNDGTNKVTSFLKSGMGYSRIFRRHGTWHEETDHGRIGRVIEQERAAFHGLAAAHAAYLTPAPLDNAGVVEYVTCPFDETHAATRAIGAGWFSYGNTVRGTAEMVNTMNAITASINAKRALADSQAVAGVQIGVPQLADWVAAEGYYQTGAGSGAAAHARMVAAQGAQRDLYIQTTMGILPEKMGQFFDEARDHTQAHVARGAHSAEDTNNRQSAALIDIRRAMGEIRNRLPGLMAPFVGAGGMFNAATAAEQQAVTGWIRMILTNTLGASVWRRTRQLAGGGGVDKNMVSFLPKTALDQVGDSLPAAVRPSNFTAAERLLLIQAIEAVHQAAGVALLGLDANLTAADFTGSPPALGITSLVYISEVVGGIDDAFNAAQLGHNQRSLSPENPDKGGRVGAGGSRAIPMETRHFTAAVAPADLANYANEMAALANAANA